MGQPDGENGLPSNHNKHQKSSGGCQKRTHKKQTMCRYTLVSYCSVSRFFQTREFPTKKGEMYHTHMP